jgi:hypothetical protein
MDMAKLPHKKKIQHDSLLSGNSCLKFMSHSNFHRQW